MNPSIENVEGDITRLAVDAIVNGINVLLCRCARARAVTEADFLSARRRLDDAGVRYEAVDDLCALAGRRDPALGRWARAERGWILACQPRAVRWLFAAADAPLSPGGPQLLRLAEPLDLREVIESASGAAEGGVGTKETAPAQETEVARVSPAPGEAEGLAWFPVIDFDRCTHCLQCLSFCLFGVFGVSAEKRVRVEHPENCKPNCPACARVCPDAAILFPKSGSPVMNGAELPESGAGRETMKVDLSALLGGDLYDRLRARGRSPGGRFSKERDADTALAERRRWLAEAAQAVPPEVLASLPSLTELQQRAADAQDRARQALKDRSAT